jgi:hypothetical protein
MLMLLTAQLVISCQTFVKIGQANFPKMDIVSASLVMAV